MKIMKPFTEREYDESVRKFRYFDTRTDAERRRWWTKARVPGEVRKTRMPGGSGFRNNWEG